MSVTLMHYIIVFLGDTTEAWFCRALYIAQKSLERISREEA